MFYHLVFHGPLHVSEVLHVFGLLHVFVPLCALSDLYGFVMIRKLRDMIFLENVLHVMQLVGIIYYADHNRSGSRFQDEIPRMNGYERENAILYRGDMCKVRVIGYISCDGCRGITVQVFNKVLDRCVLYTPIIERCGAFSAFIDITRCRPHQRVVRELFDDLSAICTGVRMGVGHNKLIARLAVEQGKGLGIIPYSKAKEFLKPLSVAKLWTVDENIRESLMELGITTIGELQEIPEAHLCGHFGAVGKALLACAEGEDVSSVIPNYPEWMLASCCSLPETEDLVVIEHAIQRVAGDISDKLEDGGLSAKGLFFLLTSSRGKVYKQYRSFVSPVYSKERIYQAGRVLFSKMKLSEPVIKLEMFAVKLCKREFENLDILGNASREKKSEIQNIVSSINEKFGDDAVKTGDKLSTVGRLDWLTHPIRVKLGKSGKVQVFKWRGKWRRVERCMEHWIESGQWWTGDGEKQFFFVVSEDGSAYELFYDTSNDAWYLYAGLS